jgi:putative ABC transport system permease protein
MTGLSSYLFRIIGIAKLATRRVLHRLTAGGARQTLLAVGGVALAVVLLLSVTSVGLGLAAQGTVITEATDFWITPEESQGSVVTGVEGTRFGQVHAVAAQLTARERVTHATPVLFDVARIGTNTTDPQVVFILGIIPPPNGSTVLGLPTDGFTPGDPYYANGTYNGSWTGEAILSESAATALNVTTGETLQTGGSGDAHQDLTVTETSPARGPGVAQFPVVLVHLSEAQQLTGATTRDKADQILVDVTDPAVRDQLETVYPAAEVVSRSGLLTRELQNSNLPLAVSVAAGVVAIVAGTLTIVTTIGFEVADDASTRAVLAALGLPRGTRLGLVITETLVTTLLGGVIGVIGWLVTVGVINLLATRFAAVPVAVIRPVLALYGVAIALGVGLLALPIILSITGRSSVLDALPR